MAIEQSSPELDTELLQGYLDSLGKNIVEQMFALYCQQVDIYLKDIENAQQHNSIVDWQAHCHKMKGAAASVGMCQLYEQLKVLEHTDAQQHEKVILLTELKVANQQGISAFKRWLDSCC
ncbi:Hpt domain-containing protein [Colwellia piezophila]|uniref:Hpt domain-containing protein n=1 Tax=Colwellia piezophila TaxID=211668 RepID=UPI0003A3F9D2|nr:Hpt domain-containing protein [Colwellia piezophila]